MTGRIVGWGASVNADRGALVRVAAVSVGIVGGEPCVDLDYAEDVGADVDMNYAALDDGRIVEVQGTAEGAAFGEGELETLLSLARKGVVELIALQRQAVEAAL